MKILKITAILLALTSVNAEEVKISAASSKFLPNELMRQIMLTATERNLYFDTDEWLSQGKILIGSENKIAYLDLDFNTDGMMLVGDECSECRVKLYNSSSSTTSTDAANNATEWIYQRSKYTRTSPFSGYFVKDRMCFNGGSTHHNCTTSAAPGFEFFVITSLKNNIYQNSLFTGVIGLSKDPDTKRQSLGEYL